MTVHNLQELRNTQAKLQQLEQLIQDASANTGSGKNVEVRSLTRLRDQLREEIVHFKVETGSVVRR